MLSKFLRSTYRTHTERLLMRRVIPKVINVRYADMIPASQYDIPFPKRMTLGNIIRVNWEILPLLISTAVGVFFVFSMFVWSFKNKVDIVLTSRSRENISRTMDLRNPSIHKLITINQKYEPWPEMADVLDKMKSAEKRALLRTQGYCSS